MRCSYDCFCFGNKKYSSKYIVFIFQFIPTVYSYLVFWEKCNLSRHTQLVLRTLWVIETYVLFLFFKFFFNYNSYYFYVLFSKNGLASVIFDLIPAIAAYLSVSNGTLKRTLRKRTLNHLAKLTKWLSCVVNTYLSGSLTACFYHVIYAFRVNLHSAFGWMSRNS